MRKSKNQIEETLFFDPEQEEEDTFWVTGRAPLEAILKIEGLSIFPLFSLDDLKKRNV
jgi:hypothetical protein